MSFPAKEFHIGSVVKYDFGPRQAGDHRIEGPHFAIVVQTEQLSASPEYSLIVVVYLTSRERKGGLYHRIRATAENGLDHDSTVSCVQFYTLRKDEPSLQVVGIVGKSDLYEIRDRIRRFFEIP